MKNYYKLRLFITITFFVLVILGIWNIFYPVNILDVQFGPLLQRLFVDFSFEAILLFLGVIVFTLFFGRLYCSTICPFGVFQEIADLFLKKRNKTIPNYAVKYFIAAISFGFLIGGSVIILRYLEPYTLFASYLSYSKLGVVAVFILLLIVCFKNRFFCTNICPVGTFLGILSKLSLNKIYINDSCKLCGGCEKSCPAGCIDLSNKNVDNETCVKCLKCISLCENNAIKWGLKPKTEIKFDLKRRKVIIGAVALSLFGIMAKAGSVLKEKVVEKIKDVILPPGAVSKQRMVNKCYNCNICVEKCPNEVIVKANKDFPTVHLDYASNSCAYNCTKCGDVCPTGAIKRLTLEQKQKTKIGIAVVYKDNCHNCSLCSKSCPTCAILKEADQPPVIDTSKCIGCGSCESACKYGAIKVAAIDEQKTI